MITRERTLLGLAIVGFLVPNGMLIAFIADEGLDVGEYLGDWFGSLPASQITVDILLAFLAFALWSAWEGRRIGMRRWWVGIAGSVLVGLCFGLPLFLLLRERALAARAPLPPDARVASGT